MINWTDECPKPRKGRKGYSYYLWAENGNPRHKYCNRMFTSIDNAQNSYCQLVYNKLICDELIANIFDVEKNKIVRICYFTKHPEGFLELNSKNLGDENV